ncbi:nSTAND1 domain-containing NTPase [Mangrovihabitans endophyticus]|uniref:WD40 repeat n=1 Tax=Mangrovihabitans endophyticus TaxID=1751298 RepID=A0A8J3C865_9ACTN|nr:AAA family ATPase [Mangrovihabitans endophyticus]GGL21029.1 hypothetical protein GCM10012284_64630 [Mangrovihabitans endophyticus]
MEYRREMGGLLGTMFVGIAINILTAETDTWWGPLRPVARYPYLWLPLCIVGWFVWRYVADRRSAVVWRGPESPYPGLSAFDEDRAAVFFGRERETSEILDRLQRAGIAPPRRVVAVVGPSGVGKSSLLRAGVLPRLPKRWRVVGPIRPATDPFLAMATALGMPDNVGRAARLLRDEGADAAELLARLSGPAVLVVDQLEDLYTMTGAADRDAWWCLIGRTLARLPELRLLVAVRPEFRRHLTDQPDALVTRPIAVGPLDTARIRQAIVRPARAAGITFEDDLVDRIVADATVGDALPLLGHLLQRLSTDRHITIAQYESVGEVGGAIATHARQLYESLAKEFPAASIDRALLRGISLENDRAVRRPIPRSSLDEAEVRILEEFRTARLVVDVTDGDCLELTHDAIFRHWGHLATLIADNEGRLRRIARLEHRAVAWQAQPRDDDLLRGQTLADAAALAEEAAVSDVALRLLEASWEADRKERVSRSERVAESAQQLREQDRELAVALVRAAITELAPSAAANATLWGLTAVPDTCCLAIGHTSGITSVVWLPDDRRLRTADQAGRVCTWDQDGRLAAVSFAVEAGLAGKTILSPDGRYALTERDRGAGLWRVDDCRLLSSRKGSLGASFDTVSWGAGGLLAGQFDRGTVDVYRLAGEAPELIASLAVDHVRATAWSPCGDRLAVATDDQLRVYAMGEQQELILQADVSWSTPTLSWSADGVHLAVGAAPALKLRNLDVLRRDQRTLRIYNTDRGTLTSCSLAGLHKALAFAPTGEVIAFAVDRIRRHERVALFDLGTGKILERRARQHEVAQIAWSADGARIGLGSSSRDVEIWDVPARSFRRLATGDISKIAWSPDRRRAAIGRLGMPLEIVEASGGAPQRLDERGTHALTWSPQGGLIAASCQEQVSVWDADTGDLRARWGRPPRRTPKRIRPQMTFPWAYSLAWSGDGSRLLVWNQDFYERTDRSLTVWDVAEARQIAALTGGERSNSILAWSPDSQLIAATMTEHDIVFWRGDDYSPAGQWQTGRSERISALAWSPDSERLAAALGSQIEIWNAAEQRPHVRWVGNDDTVRHLCWSPDGLYLAGVGLHGVLSIWRALDGRPLAVVDCPRGGVLDLHWAARLTATTSNGTIFAWTPSAAFATPPAADNATRTLTAEDRQRYGLPG